MQPGELQWAEGKSPSMQTRKGKTEDRYSSQSVRPGEPQLNVVDGHKPVTDHTLGTTANHHRLVHMTQYELLKGKTEESAQHFQGGGEEERTGGAIKKPVSMTQSFCKALS